MSALCFILTSAAVTCLAVASPCPYQPCSCDDVSIQCHSRSITSLPALQHGHFPQHDLDISFCNIGAIRSGQLPAGLSSLSSRYTPIASIDDDAFTASASTLNSIFIEGSQLTELPGALLHLPNLTSFDWSENPMKSWNTTILSSMSKTLTSLAIENMNLNTTNLGWLTKFTSVESLSLYHTQITAIPPSVTRYSKLTYLLLASNRITSINHPSLPASLQDLTIFTNAITSISKVHFRGGASQLKTLRISNNPISHISADAFALMSSLTRIDLSATDLTRLPLTLGSLDHLTDLDLHNVPKLVCTCQESALAPWYRNMTSLTIKGSCGDSTITYFLSQLAPSCPGR